MKELDIGNNVTIAYKEISGNKNNPAIIFLHEGLGCIEMWKQFPEQLCKLLDCRGLVYDRQGYGHSSPLSKKRTIHYLHEYALQELPLVIAALLPDQPFFIVGHSDGATIGLIYAAENDSHLLGLITEAAHIFVEEKTIEGIHKAVDLYNAGKLSSLKKYHGAKTNDIFTAWSDTWLSDWYRHWNLEYLLPSIFCPVLVMQGIEDQYATELQVDKIMFGLKGMSEKIMIGNCGHTPHDEQRAVALELMKAFYLKIVSC